MIPLFVFCDVYLHLQLPIATGNEVRAADLSALRVFQRDAGRSASLPGPGGNLGKTELSKDKRNLLGWFILGTSERNKTRTHVCISGGEKQSGGN